MILTLLVWLYTLFLCYVYGHLFFKSLRTAPPLTPLVIVTGMIALTTLASFFSLFLEIELWFNLLILAGALAATLTRNISAPRLQRPLAMVPLIVLGLALLLLLENATHRTINPDTNIYHAQAIHWIESFPAVPGLGNLHGRLAFNSAWFVSNAIFSLPFLGLGSFHLTASVLFLAVICYFWGGFGAMLRGEYTPATLLKVLFFPLAFSLLGAEISSPGTDLPVSLLLWLMAVLWAEADQPLRPLLITLLAAFLVTIKLSAAPGLLLAAAALGVEVFTPHSERLKNGFLRALRVSVIPALICGAFVLTPFLVRNIILSGYLLYPVPTIDLFSFDWKVPLDRVTGEQMSVLAWGRFPRLDAAKVLAMPLEEWLPKWFAAQTANRRLILNAALLSAFLALPGLWLTRRYWLGWLAFFLGTLFWLLSAPDFRFGQGFLIGTILLALAPWAAAFLQRFALPPARVTWTVSVLVSLYLGFALVTSFDGRTFASRVLLPLPYDRVSTQTCNLVNGQVFCAKAYNACSYDAFPCVPSPRPKVELRNPNLLRDGFRTVP